MKHLFYERIQQIPLIDDVIRHDAVLAERIPESFAAQLHLHEVPMHASLPDVDERFLIDVSIDLVAAGNMVTASGTDVADASRCRRLCR